MKECYETQCKSLTKAWQKAVLLLTIDESWKVNLRELDQLRQSVQNASYEQKDPLVIYKLESFKLFQAMLGEMNNKSVSTLMRGAIPEGAADPSPAQHEPEPRRQQYRESRGDDAVAAAQRANAAASQGASRQGAQHPTAPIHVGPKVGRNDPCPCGSGKKYKNCHGRGL